MSDGLFSRKDRRYWLLVTGGMIFIGIVNVIIGYLMWDAPPPEPPPRAFPRPVVPGSKSPWPSSLDSQGHDAPLISK